MYIDNTHIEIMLKNTNLYICIFDIYFVASYLSESKIIQIQLITL